MLDCLKRNLENPAIDHVHLLLERVAPPLEHPRLVVRAAECRPSYEDFFVWANEVSNGDIDLSIICNSDIYFDSSVAAAMQLLNERRCIALARWDQRGSEFRLRDRNDSQDSWIFRGKIPPVVANFAVGVPRCDNRILHELQASGLQVINPARSLRSYHLHAGDREEYSGANLKHFVEPPYSYLWPHNAYHWPSTVLHNIRNRNSRLKWQLDYQRLYRSLFLRVTRKLRSMFGRQQQESV